MVCQSFNMKVSVVAIAALCALCQNQEQIHLIWCLWPKNIPDHLIEIQRVTKSKCPCDLCSRQTAVSSTQSSVSRSCCRASQCSHAGDAAASLLTEVVLGTRAVMRQLQLHGCITRPCSYLLCASQTPQSFSRVKLSLAAAERCSKGRNLLVKDLHSGFFSASLLEMAHTQPHDK